MIPGTAARQQKTKKEYIIFNCFIHWPAYRIDAGARISRIYKNCKKIKNKKFQLETILGMKFA